MSTLKVNQLLDTSGNILERVLSKEHKAEATKLISTSTSYVNLLEDTITTTVANSKILIFCQLNISKYNSHSMMGRLLRNNTNVAPSTADYSNHEDGTWWNVRSNIYSTPPQTIVYLDSPSASAGTTLTYTAQGKTTHSSHSFGFNRNTNNANTLHDSPTFSNMVLLELPA